MTPASLELQGVRSGYGSRTVLDGLDLAIPVGTMAALLGPNGSGKSTLLNLCAGVLRPAAGHLLLDGADLQGVPARERARRVAMVAQTLPIPFAFTVEEWVSLGRTPYLSTFGGESAADRTAVRGAMERADVLDLAGRLIGEISGGERQRAALAMALAQEPGLLLLDEATAHLDLHHQMSLLGRVRQLNRDAGLTVLAAVHDPNLAALWFDRLLVLHGGRIAADGTPREVLRPEVLEPVFQCRVHILPHPTENVPLVALQR